MYVLFPGGGHMSHVFVSRVRRTGDVRRRTGDVRRLGRPNVAQAGIVAEYAQMLCTKRFAGRPGCIQQTCRRT